MEDPDAKTAPDSGISLILESRELTDGVSLCVRLWELRLDARVSLITSVAERGEAPAA